jgi:hypothetical protein
MLERLLQLVAEGGLHSHESLARRLSVSSVMLEAMLGDLTRLGYLSAAVGGCGGGCGHCASKGCLVTAAGRLWALTEKGARAAARVRPPSQTG